MAVEFNCIQTESDLRLYWELHSRWCDSSILGGITSQTNVKLSHLRLNDVHRPDNMGGGALIFHGIAVIMKNTRIESPILCANLAPRSIAKYETEIWHFSHTLHNVQRQERSGIEMCQLW